MLTSAPTHVVLQDGYAVHSSDGPGEYTVEFEALAGTAPGRLTKGCVAYVGTGRSPTLCLAEANVRFLRLLHVPDFMALPTGELCTRSCVESLPAHQLS